MAEIELADYQRALRVWERMLAMEMDALQRSNLLRRIGDGCLEIIEHKNDPEVCRRAIDAYEEALQFYSAESYPALRARVLRGLGSAYSSLADLSERRGSLARAISCWEEALGFFAAASFPEDHAAIQNELSGAYRKLAELESRRDNAKLAIAASLVALSIYRSNDLLLDCAAAQLNLAGAYLILAQAAGYAADQADGCRKAMAACREALAGYAQDRYPARYAAAKNRLAIAYLALSQVEEREENCRNAIFACQEALSGISREEEPLAYAALQNSLGNAYLALAEEAEAREDREMMQAEPGRGPEPARKQSYFRAGEDGKWDLELGREVREEKVGEEWAGEGMAGEERTGEDLFLELCRLALDAYSQAAGIYSRDEHPWLYATAQNNLSSVYLAIGRREDGPANSSKGMKAAEVALSFFTLENFPQDYAEAQMNLWMAYLMMADIEYRAENCSAALDAARERLKATLKFGQPLQLAGCYKDLAITACMLADVDISPEDKESHCREAIDAALEALRIYRVQSNPAEYAETQTLLWAAYLALAEVDGRAESCKRAIYACQAAIRVYDKISSGEKAYAQKNLAHSFISLAEMEKRSENCQSAIEAWQDALKYYTEERAPMEHADILLALAYAYVLLSQEEREEEAWLKKALKCYKKALKIYQQREREMAGIGDPAAHEAGERAERCQRSLQSCRAMIKARRKQKTEQIQRKEESGK
jgi:tetratricopeptide (TPR) repeat protein